MFLHRCCLLYYNRNTVDNICVKTCKHYNHRNTVDNICVKTCKHYNRNTVPNIYVKNM